MSRPTYAKSKDIGAIPVLIGHLLKGVFIFLGRKARSDGIPKAIQFAKWLHNQTIFLIRKSNEVGKPRVIEFGQISKGLLIFVARKIKANGVPMVISITQFTTDFSSLFYIKSKNSCRRKGKCYQTI